MIRLHRSSIRTFTAVLTAFLSLASPLRAADATLSKNAVVSDEEIQKLEAIHSRAEDRILKNDFRAAIKIYQEILLEEPDDETSFTGMAQCYMVLGDFPRAKDAYQNALHINPDNETALLGLQKIADPDSMNIVERETVSEPAPLESLPVLPAGPEPTASSIPAPVPAAIPIRYPQEAAAAPAPKAVAPMLAPVPTDPDDIRLGARKSMAPYSVDIPKPLKDLSRTQLVQAALKNAGLYRGPIDGIIGPFTRKAIREFQAKYDLVVDGKPGPKTWELLQPFLNPNDFEVKLLQRA